MSELNETDGGGLAEDVREALKRVIDPELGLNIVDLGLIEELTGRGGEEANKIIEFMQMILEHEKTGREAMELEY